jgi:alpha,alpha-trehalose phosphorylase
LPYAEGGYGYPESGQTVIDVTNGKLIRLLVDDEPFDMRYGQVQKHERELDFRDGILRRTVSWTSPAGRSIQVTSARIVSFTQRSIAAIHYEVKAIDCDIRVVLQSELVANEASAALSKDPRTATFIDSPLVSEEHEARDTAGILIHHTRVTNLRVGAAMDHIIEGPDEMQVDAQSYADIARVTVTAPSKLGRA